MKQFGRLVRDVETINTPYGSYQYARNILRTKGYKSISNEYSHKYHVLVPGIIIGVIDTNTEIVYFIKKHDGTDEIGRVKLDADTPTYIKDINSNFLGFKYTQPIEGIFTYNYKNELIIVFCDGVQEDANTPKIVNLDNPNLDLTEDKILYSSKVNKMELFPNVTESNTTISYLDSGSIEGNVAYITYCYVFPDGSASPYFSISNIAYLQEGTDNLNSRGVRIKFNNLDLNYNKIKVGIVIRKDDVLTGYESYDISYTNAVKEVDITSLNNFTQTAAESIILEKSVFDRIETITTHRNQAIIGNYRTPKEEDLQKYALKLNLKPYKYISKTNEPSLMPDEVYAIYIQVQWLNGTYSNALHIPGRKVKGTYENAPWSASNKATYNAYWTDSIENGNFKYFHLINEGRVNLDGSIAEFGYWENEELYPNSEHFDGRTGYSNEPIENGEDLRSKPIRYHRMPDIYNSSIYDTSLYSLDSNNLEDNEFFHLGIKVTNFAEAFPAEIRNRIQGYRLCFVKRNFGNSLVTGNYALLRKGSLDWTQASVDLTWEYHDFNVNERSDELYFGDLDINFSKGRLLSTELFKLRPSIDLTYIKLNYFFNIKSKGTRIFPDDLNRFTKVKTNPKYVLGNNLVVNTQYHEEGIDIEFDNPNFNTFVSGENPIDARYYSGNITAISHKTNVYNGFKSNSLVVLGRTNTITSEATFKGGDVFTANEIDIQVHTAKLHRYTTAGGRTVAWRYPTNIKMKGLFSPLNSLLLFNEKVENNINETIGDNERPERIETDVYNSQDYDFDVKGESDLSTINDINSILTFDINANFINEFPFRIHRGLKVAKESLSTNSLRTFLTDDYYEIANDKGEIIAVRGSDRALFIQHRFTLFAAVIKDKLRAGNVDAFLGTPELFEREPEEVLADTKGTIASVSKFSCKFIKGIYISINAVDGKIYLVKEGAKEITAIDNKNWFAENWDIGLDFYRLDNLGNKRRVDNPFVSVGYTVGYDELNERLIFTKRFFKPKQDFVSQFILKFDGQIYRDRNNSIVDLDDTTYFENKCITISFDLIKEEWICEHDYYPNYYYRTSNKLYALVNKFSISNKESDIFEFNDINSVGTFLGNKFSSYVDLAFTANSDISKLLQSITFITTVKKDNKLYREDTINAIMVYNNYQCSGIISISHKNLTRLRNDEFSFNEFRDLVIDENDIIINQDGSVNLSNIDLKKLWFERANIIGKFVIIRLIMNNLEDKNVFLHEINTLSEKSM